MWFEGVNVKLETWDHGPNDNVFQYVSRAISRLSWSFSRPTFSHPEKDFGSSGARPVA